MSVHRFHMTSDTFRPSLLVVLSAALYSISLSCDTFWFCSLFSLVPFLYVIERESTRPRVFIHGACWGVLATAGTSYWLFHALVVHYGKSVPFSFLFFFFLAALPMAILYGFLSSLYRLSDRRRYWFYCAVFPSLWVVSEIIREILPVFIPWGFAGYGAAGNILFAQIADIAGIYGLSFAAVLINALLFMFMTGINIVWDANPTRRWRTVSFPGSRHLIPIAISVFTVAVIFLYGSFRIYEWNNSTDLIPRGATTIGAVVVQGSHELRDRWDDRSFEIRLQTYLMLTEKALESPVAGVPGLIIWPETVLNSPRAFYPLALSRISKSVPAGSVLLSGGVRPSPGKKLYNSVIMIENAGISRWYDKNILLPFAEYRPFNSGLLGEFYNAPDRFSRGNTPGILENDYARIGVSICFESAYPRFIRRSVAGGAQLLVNVSNDAWFGRTSQPYQHHLMARVRSIENRRFTVRASNGGVSSIISPLGEIIAQTGLFERKAITGTVVCLDRKSVYTSYGDVVLLFPLAVLIISFCVNFLFSGRPE